MGNIAGAWWLLAEEGTELANTTTSIGLNEPGFQYDMSNLRIEKMTTDLDGTQFRYDTSLDLQLDPVFTSNWTMTIIG